MRIIPKSLFTKVIMCVYSSATGFFRVIANTYVLFVFNGLFGNKTGNDVMQGMIAVRKFLYGVRWVEHD